MLELIENPLEGIMLFKVLPELNDSSVISQCLYDKRILSLFGINTEFVQDNESISCGNVLRGMHFQNEYDQEQLVWAAYGSVFDAVVDVRPDSSTYGKYFSVNLTEANGLVLYMAKGFAHGFYTISDKVVMHYKCSEFYHPGDEGGLIYNDPNVGINWPLEGKTPIMSDKDKLYPGLEELKNRRILNGAI